MIDVGFVLTLSEQFQVTAVVIPQSLFSTHSVSSMLVISHLLLVASFLVARFCVSKKADLRPTHQYSHHSNTDSSHAFCLFVCLYCDAYF